MSAAEIPRPTAADLARLEEARLIPEQPGEYEEFSGCGPVVRRNATGELPRWPLDSVRRAMLKSLDQQQMTRYELWKKARAHHKSLSASAVYEYLRGARDLGIESVEALMKAANLKVVPQKTNVEAPRPAVFFVGAGMAAAKAKVAAKAKAAKVTTKAKVAVKAKAAKVAAKATVKRPKHSSKA
jgi:hypothetical protein